MRSRHAHWRGTAGNPYVENVIRVGPPCLGSAVLEALRLRKRVDRVDTLVRARAFPVFLWPAQYGHFLRGKCGIKVTEFAFRCPPETTSSAHAFRVGDPNNYGDVASSAFSSDRRHLVLHLLQPASETSTPELEVQAEVGRNRNAPAGARGVAEGSRAIIGTQDEV